MWGISMEGSHSYPGNGTRTASRYRIECGRWGEHAEPTLATLGMMPARIRAADGSAVREE